MALKHDWTGVCRFHCSNLGVTERHKVVYRLRTAAEGTDGIEQWWTVEKCKQRRVVAQGRILGVHQQCMESQLMSVNLCVQTVFCHRGKIQSKNQ